MSGDRSDRARAAEELLASGRDDVPPEGSLERELARLGVSVAAAGTQAPSSTAAAASKLGLAFKWTALAAALASVTAGYSAWSARVAPAASPVAVPPAQSRPQGASAAPEEPREHVASSSEPAVTAAVSPHELPSAPARPVVTSRSSAARTPAAPVAAAASLAEELARLDRARALARTTPVASLAMLDEHAREFPASRLREEAALIRVEALLAAGRRDDAERVAEPLLRARAGAPIARRLTDLLERR